MPGVGVLGRDVGTAGNELSTETTWVFPKIGGFYPKSSILIGFSIINHLFWDTPIFGNTHMDVLLEVRIKG